MAKINANFVLFNLGGVVVLATVAGYIGTGFFATDTVQPCSTRYPAGLRYSLEGRNGAPLSAIEIQARGGMQAYGVLQNAKVVAPKEQGAQPQLDVNLASVEDDNGTEINGAGFQWPVAAIGDAQSACLSYAVKLPDEMRFEQPGRLPGLSGFDPLMDARNAKFAANLGWANSGALGVEVRAATASEGWVAPIKKVVWPRGRWVPVEQEITFNAPGQRNGVVRVWVDGKLRINSAKLELRANPDMRFSGVTADTGFTRGPAEPVVVSMTPFVVQWQ